MSEMVLETRDLHMAFGGLVIFDCMNFALRRGERHAIIGPNGAGKTSLLNCISGLYRPQVGEIVFHAGDRGDRNLVRTKPGTIARLGIARTFQNIELFRHMTVLENLMLGRHTHMKHNLFRSLLYYGPAQRQEIGHRELVEEVIDLLEIQSVRNKQVGALAYGFQKRVEMGRALCMQPSLLLLDEPMAGMNAEEKEDMARFILDVNDLAGVTTVLIEHDMGVIMDISDRVSVLDFGRCIADGTPADVGSDQAVRDAYLGQEANA
jgi:branched-chain amino acid transport system ATP-binding protein